MYGATPIGNKRKGGIGYRNINSPTWRKHRKEKRKEESEVKNDIGDMYKENYFVGYREEVVTACCTPLFSFGKGDLYK